MIIIDIDWYDKKYWNNQRDCFLAISPKNLERTKNVTFIRIMININVIIQLIRLLLLGHSPAPGLWPHTCAAAGRSSSPCWCSCRSYSDTPACFRRWYSSHKIRRSLQTEPAQKRNHIRTGSHTNDRSSHPLGRSVWRSACRPSRSWSWWARPESSARSWNTHRALLRADLRRDGASGRRLDSRVQVDLVRLHARFVSGAVRVPAVDLEPLDSGLSRGRRRRLREPHRLTNQNTDSSVSIHILLTNQNTDTSVSIHMLLTNQNTDTSVSIHRLLTNQNTDTGVSIHRFDAHFGISHKINAGWKRQDVHKLKRLA